MFTLDEILANNGGMPRISGGQRILWFGMNPSDPVHTQEIADAFDPNDPIVPLTGDRIILPKYAGLVNGGKYPAYSWQLSGSCVNSGAQNAMITLEGIIRAIRDAAGVFIRPWTLTAYGYSRKIGFNDDTTGEGSTGDAMAIALRDVGTCEFDKTFLPAAVEAPIAFHYTKNQELYYSAAHNSSQEIVSACKSHKIKFIKIETLDQAETEIRRARPFTIAGNWGSRMQMIYKGTGANRILYGDYQDTWEHQMSCHGVWKHPDFGRLWLIFQNWYMSQGGVIVPVHGQPATDEPPGTFWVDDSMIQHQLNYRFGELRSFADFTGFDEGNINVLGV